MDQVSPEDLEAPYPQYRCQLCGKDLPLNEARMTVTCAEHIPHDEPLQFDVRMATSADRHEIEEICDRAWGETEIDVFGATFDVMRGINLIADCDGALAGLLSLTVARGELAIVLLSVYPEYSGKGVGSALIRAAIEYAERKALPVIVAGVSNDDMPSLYFYQRHGFRIYDIAVGALVQEDGSQPGGFSDIPVRDEIRLRRSVCPPR